MVAKGPDPPLQPSHPGPGSYPSSTVPSVATSCLACARAHLATVSGLLKEALRFARTDGVQNAEVLVRIQTCLEEIGALERHDWAPERLLASPAPEQETIHRFLPEVRTLRQALTQVANPEDLERVAAQAAEIGLRFSTESARLGQGSPAPAAEEPAAAAPADVVPAVADGAEAGSPGGGLGVWAEVEQLWENTQGDPQIRIALLDGPVDQTHPALQGAVLTGSGLRTEPGSAAGAATGHGTAMASVIFGRHGGPVAGLAPGCSGLIIPIYGEDEAGRLIAAQQSVLAQAIVAAVEGGAHIINVSGGESAPDGAADARLLDAIELCRSRNVLLISSTGNGGCECLQVPAAAASVLAVGAMADGGLPSSFSNWGEQYRAQGLLAPGEQLTVAVPGGGVGTASGTSLAAAFVSGVAGLFLSLQAQQGQKPDPLAVRDALLATAHRCDPEQGGACERFLTGTINVEGAVQQIRAAVEPAALETFAITEGRSLTMEVSKELVQPMTTAAGGETPARVDHGMVYALGQIGFDFGLDARLDAIKALAGGKDVTVPANLLALLNKHPYVAADIIWTFEIDGVPVYALHARGAFASVVHERLREFLRDQVENGVERVSIPGYLTTQTVRLRTGQELAVVQPELRGMYSWDTADLVKSLMEAVPVENPAKHQKNLVDFLNRIYFELRNFGRTPQERALNFAATNAFQLGYVYSQAVLLGMELSGVSVEASPLSRPGSDCWDVRVTLFRPDKLMQEAKREFRFTVDVSDVVPVTVGPIRSWSVF